MTLSLPLPLTLTLTLTQTVTGTRTLPRYAKNADLYYATLAADPALLLPVGIRATFTRHLHAHQLHTLQLHTLQLRLPSNPGAGGVHAHSGRGVPEVR